VEVSGTSGVPEITQVFGSTVVHAGRAAVGILIPQEVIAEPLSVRVVGETLIATPTVPDVPLAPAKERTGVEVPVPVKSKFTLPGLESASV
jgi:hypothetical protein